MTITYPKVGDLLLVHRTDGPTVTGRLVRADDDSTAYRIVATDGTTLAAIVGVYRVREEWRDRRPCLVLRGRTGGRWATWTATTPT